jgi:hypothetical protein
MIMDLDDYWLPTKEHPLHSLIVQNKMNEKITAATAPEAPSAE